MLLTELLPERYRRSGETIQIQRAIQGVADGFAAAYDDMLRQLSASMATTWIESWERAYGILPDAEKPLEYRRTRILSKMRGSGTTTVQLIQNVAGSFSGGEVEVIEVQEENRFDIKFVGTLGVPPNMEDLTATIEEIKPAHLAYAYVIIYRLWGRLKDRTWGQLKTYTWGQVKGGSMDDGNPEL